MKTSTSDLTLKREHRKEGSFITINICFDFKHKLLLSCLKEGPLFLCHCWVAYAIHLRSQWFEDVELFCNHRHLHITFLVLYIKILLGWCLHIMSNVFKVLLVDRTIFLLLIESLSSHKAQEDKSGGIECKLF